MMMIVEKVVDNMAWRLCIPFDSVKSRDDYFSFVHKLEIGANVDSDKSNLGWLKRCGVKLCYAGLV